MGVQAARSCKHTVGVCDEGAGGGDIRGVQAARSCKHGVGVGDNGKEAGGVADGAAGGAGGDGIRGVQAAGNANTMWAPVCDNEAEAGGAADGATGGTDGGDIRGVQAAGSCNHAVGVCDTWNAALLSIHNPDVTCRFFRALSSKSVLDASCMEDSEQDFFQMQQLFNSCDFRLEEGVRARMAGSFVALKDRIGAACKAAFMTQPTKSSASQQQVSDELWGMELWVEDEFRCAKSGYSIDMRFHRSDAGKRGWGVGWRRWHIRLHSNSEICRLLAKEYDIKANMKSCEIVAQLFQKGYTHVTSTPHIRLDGNVKCGAGWAVEFDGTTHFLGRTATVAPVGRVRP